MQIAFTLPDAVITLYPVDSQGEAIASSPLWTGIKAENLRISERFEEAETRPTGVRYPVVRHVNTQHEITIDRVWVANQPHTPNADRIDYVMTPNTEYVMAIVWQSDRDEDRWIARVYYGVTQRSHDLASRDLAEFTGAQAFRAKYYVEKNGKGTPVVCV